MQVSVGLVAQSIRCFRQLGKQCVNNTTHLVFEFAIDHGMQGDMLAVSSFYGPGCPAVL